MHHPFHIHGAGRFLVPARDEQSSPTWCGRTRVLVRRRDVRHQARRHNPGVWMAYCHIAEHHESGMMFSFQVEP